MFLFLLKKIYFLIIICCLQLANIFGRFQWLTCPRKVIFSGKVSLLAWETSWSVLKA